MLKKIILIGLLSCCIHVLHASGPKLSGVVHGTASFKTIETQLKVTVNSPSILEWDQFSIPQNHSVEFLQQGDGAVLNRVVGSEITKIDGHLRASGSCYLINSNGIIVSETGIIEANQLVLSTLELKNADFLEGNELNFFGKKGAIHNAGQITSQQQVVLVAPKITNSGVMTAGALQVGLGGDVLWKRGEKEPLAVQLTCSKAIQIFENSGQILVKPFLESTVNLKTEQNKIVIRSSVNSFVNLKGSLQAKDLDVAANEVHLSGDITAETVLIESKKTFQVSSSKILAQSLNLHAENLVYVSGTIEGSDVAIDAKKIIANGARIDVSKDDLAGNIFLGSNESKLCDTVEISSSSSILANSTKSSGGSIQIWSSQSTSSFGFLSATGSTKGGFIDVSSLGELHLSGNLDLQSSSEEKGTLLLDPYNLYILEEGMWPFYKFIDDSQGSGFGDNISVLANGNVVVCKPSAIVSENAKVGQVYLFDGITGSLLSILSGQTEQDNVGSGLITILSNNNFVVSSPNWDDRERGCKDCGAATWGSCNTGWGVGTTFVNSNNSLIGATDSDQVSSGGILALKNDNFVVFSPNYTNKDISQVGAATFGEGKGKGYGPELFFGQVSADNSLVGEKTFDRVSSMGGIALENGNYVVISEHWNAERGAVTFGNGFSGRFGPSEQVGVVSSDNSIVGDLEFDQVGSNGVVSLVKNSNYIIASPTWGSNRGAVSWGSGSAGSAFIVSAENSLIGTTSGDTSTGDRIGQTVLSLSNGNFIVLSPYWNDSKSGNPQVGAVTFGEGEKGLFGPLGAGSYGEINEQNSLLGSSSNDQIGFSGAFEIGKGNYIVASPFWDSEEFVEDVGAITFCYASGTSIGSVKNSNSLTGSHKFDRVGIGGVTTLLNGNFVVNSYLWNDFAGAVTWCIGDSPTTGVVNEENSLIGSSPFDRIGSAGIVPLTNANYVVVSPDWQMREDTLGAVTFGNGSNGRYGREGLVGAVVAQSSLIGSHMDDFLNVLVNPLSNGNYLVNIPFWDKGPTADVGACVFGYGEGGVQGIVDPEVNALIGSSVNDRISSGGTIELPNSLYLVLSPFWDQEDKQNVGAATTGSSFEGIKGVINLENSIVGPKQGDSIGSGGAFIRPDGGFVILNPDFQNEVGEVVCSLTWAGGGFLPTNGYVSRTNSVIGNKNEGATFLSYNNPFSDTVVSRFTDNQIYVGYNFFSSLSFNRGQGNLFNTELPNQPTQSMNIHPRVISNLLDQGVSVTLQADNNISIQSPIISSGVANLSFQAGGAFYASNPISLGGGSINIVANSPDSPTPTVSSNITLNRIDGPLILYLDSGFGNVEILAPIGESTPLDTIVFSNVTSVLLGSSIALNGTNSINFSPLVQLTNDSSVTTNTINSLGNTITFAGITGSYNLNLNAGTAGLIQFTQPVGSAPLTKLITSANKVEIYDNIFLTGNNPLDFTVPVELFGNSLIRLESFFPTGNDISFSSLSGGHELTLNAGNNGVITFNSIVGATPLKRLAFQNAASINVYNSITTTNHFALNFSRPVSLLGNSNISTTGGGSSGSGIIFSSSLDGGYNLTLDAGSAGLVQFLTGVGTSTPLNRLAFTNAAEIQIFGDVYVNNSYPLSFINPVSFFANSLVTTTGGGTISGNNISFSDAVNGARNVTLDAGTSGIIQLNGAVGGVSPLTQLAFTNASQIQVGSNITVTNANPLNFNKPTTLTGNSIVATTGSGSSGNNITFGSTLNGARVLTLDAGTSGIIQLNGVVGGVSPLTQLAFTNASQIQVANNITVTNANPLNFNKPTTLTGNSIVATTGSGGVAGNNITFGSTLDGVQSLTLNAGTSGIIQLNGVVGGVSPLTQLAFTNASQIQVGSNITVTNANPLNFNKPTTLTGNSIVATTGSGGVAGNDITFGSTLNGAKNLILDAGTSGIIQLNGVVGGVSPLTQLAFTNASQIQVANNITVTNANPLNFNKPTTLTGNSIVATTGSGGVAGNDITFGSTLDGAQSLTLNAGTSGIIQLNGVVGGVSPLTQLAFTNASQIQVGSNITVTNANPLNFNKPTTLTGNSIVATTGSGGVAGNNITFGSTLNGAQVLTLDAGLSGDITFNGRVGGVNPLKNIVFGNCEKIFASNNITTSGDNQLNFSKPVIFTGNSQISNPNNDLIFADTISGPFELSLSAGTGKISFSGDVGITVADYLNRLQFLSCSEILIDGNIRLSGNHPLIFISPVTLGTHLTVATQSFQLFSVPQINIENPQDITFSSTVNGLVDLSIETFALGDVIFNNFVGNITPIESLVVNAKNIQADKLITALEIVSLQSLATSTSMIPDGVIILKEGIDASNILLAPAGRAQVVKTATIWGNTTSEGSNLILTTSASGSIVVGDYEAMTIFGDISLDSNNITIGDVVALGQITINAQDTITIKLHEPGLILDWQGGLYESTSTHLVSALATPNLNGDIITVLLNPAAQTYTSLQSQFSYQDLNYQSYVLNYQLQSPIPPKPPQPTIQGESSYIAAVTTFNQLNNLNQIMQFLPIGKNFRDLRYKNKSYIFSSNEL
jgi:filamentous hemagglutinin family protein